MYGEKGLTLLEVLISLAIMSILTLIIYTFLAAGLKLWDKQATNIDVKESIAAAMSLISQEIRNGCNVTVDGTNHNSIIIDVWSDSATKRQIKYYLDGSTIRRSTKPYGSGFFSGNNEVVKGISDFWVGYSSPEKDLVTVKITAQGQKKQYTFATKVFVRNLHTGEGG